MTDNEDKVYIITGVTMHMPGPNFDRRVESRGLGSDNLPCALGNDDIVVVEPGNPVGPLPRLEAEALIAKFGGRIISDPQIKDK